MAVLAFKAVNPTPSSGQPDDELDTSIGGAADRAYLGELRKRIHGSPSGQYGELEEMAIDAAINVVEVVWRPDFADLIKALVRGAHPTYAAALEAKDRQLSNWEATRLDENGALWKKLQQAEQREAEARRLLGELTEECPSTGGPSLHCAYCEWHWPNRQQRHATDCPWIAAKNFLESKP